MTVRMTLSLGLLLLCGSAVLAQNATLPTPTAPVPQFVEESGLSATMPVNAQPPGGQQFWVFGDYMFSYVRGADLPALVTTSPAGTPQATAGVLGNSTTHILIGSTSRVDDNLRSGFRFGGGYWFNPEQTLGVEAGVMWVNTQSSSFNAASTGNPILARPFINAGNNAQDAQLIAFPGVGTGSIAVQANSGALYGANLDIVDKSLDYGWFRLNSLIGYRFFSYTESLGIQQTFSPTGGQFVPGSQSITNDQFGTRNTFHGLDLGFRPQFYWNNLMLELLGKVAIGNLNEEVTIVGNQTVTVPGTPTIQRSGGFYALTSNMAAYHVNCWYPLIEAGATLNWQISSNIKLRVGYSFLQMNGVARAANQIDTTINPNNLPGSPTSGGGNRPIFLLNRSDLWLQSINVGLVFAF